MNDTLDLAEVAPSFRPLHGGYPDPVRMKRRPWVLMTVDEVTRTDCDAMEKIMQAGAQVVVVQTKDFERSVGLLKEAWATTDTLVPL